MAKSRRNAENVSVNCKIIWEFEFHFVKCKLKIENKDLIK